VGNQNVQFVTLAFFVSLDLLFKPNVKMEATVHPGQINVKFVLLGTTADSKSRGPI